MDIFRKRTQAERKVALDDYNSVDPMLQHMVAPSDVDFLAKIEGGTTVEEIRIDEPRPLTKSEQDEQTDELNRLSLFGGVYAAREYSNIPVIAQMQRAEERAGLEKLLGHQPRVQPPFDEMFSTAWNEAVAEFKKRYDNRAPLAIPSSASFTKSGGRIEYDEQLNESTEYASSGALLRSWVGGPNARPAFEAMAGSPIAA